MTADLIERRNRALGAGAPLFYREPATGRRGIVCSDAAYHGTSEAVGKLTHVHRRTPERGTEVRGFPFP